MSVIWQCASNTGVGIRMDVLYNSLLVGGVNRFECHRPNWDAFFVDK